MYHANVRFLTFPAMPGLLESANRHSEGTRMLREIQARQLPGEPARRWFTSPDIDLFVWLDEAGAPTAFQLCYDKQSREHALTWTPAAGYTHMGVDGGESRPGRYKGTPILVANGSIDVEGILGQLRSQAEAVPPELLGFIEGKIGGWASSSSSA